MKKDKVIKKLCKQPKVKQRTFAPGVTDKRKGFILSVGLKWVNGTEIKYYFLEGAEPQRKVVRDAFQQWKKLGIGISFREVKKVNESMVRIGFDHSDGSWSYVGREILNIPMDERTMNFGWDLTSDAYGMTTAIHEIGHTIGFQHEHQSPFAGIDWNKPAVYAEFSGPPNNWSKGEIDSNIINKMPANQVKGSAWDPKSIMEYEFSAGLVNKPAPYQNGIFPPGIISAQDKIGVRSFYPKATSSKSSALTLNKASDIKAKSGGQNNFIFTAPVTRKFQFVTDGPLDTVMVISEKEGNKIHYLSGDDDSGTDKNAKITLPLVEGRKYLVNIRVMFAPGTQNGSIKVTSA